MNRTYVLLVTEFLLKTSSLHVAKSLFSNSKPTAIDMNRTFEPQPGNVVFISGSRKTSQKLRPLSYRVFLLKPSSLHVAKSLSSNSKLEG